MNTTLEDKPYGLNRILTNNKGVWKALLFFTLAIAPFSLSYIFMASSEQFYTDGAIHMMEKQEYMVPYFDGHLRFNKPVLTYWWVLAAYELLGVSSWTSLLPFLLTGIALLWLTAKLVNLISDRTDLAVLSVLILATHPLLIFSTARSMTELPLVLTTILGVYGAIGLLKYEGLQSRYLYYFFIGFGLSIAVKGAPGVALGGITFLYLLLNPFLKISWKRLLQPLPILLGTALAGFWFVIVYLRFPQEFLNQFFTDQVGGRVIEESSRTVSNFSKYIGTLLYAVPWIIMAIFRLKIWKMWFNSLDIVFKATLGLTFCWLLFFTFTAPFFSIFYDRYIMPVIPLLSIGFASVLLFADSTIDRWGKNFAFLLYGLTTLGLLASSFYFYYEPLVWYALAMNVIGIIFILKHNAFNAGKVYWITTLCLLGLYMNIGVIVASIANPNVGHQLAAYLKERVSPEDQIAFFYHDTKIPAKLRIASYASTTHPIFTFQRIQNFDTLQMTSPDVILFEHTQLPSIEKLSNQYTIEQAATQYAELYNIALLQPFLKEPKYFYAAFKK